MALVTISDCSSFAGAAGDLGLTASAVSKLVSRMETRLRVRLVHRTTRRVRLTELGLLYCERARRVLEELDTSERELQHVDPDPKGTLRITAPVVLGHVRVLPVAMAFQQRYPDVRVLFDATDRVVDLIQERLDVAVRMVAEPPPAMVARKLDDDVRHLCASPAYLAQQGAPRTPAELTGHQCLPCRVEGDAVPWRFKAGAGGAAKALIVDGRLHLSDTLSIREAALAGRGIADLPHYLVARDLEAGRLVRVLDAVPRVVRGIYVVYAPSPFTPTKVRLFVEALRTSFSGDYVAITRPVRPARPRASAHRVRAQMLGDDVGLRDEPKQDASRARSWAAGVGRVPARSPDMLPVVANRSPEFRSDDIVDGRYRIVRQLADGGMGTVFLAEHMLIKRRVAIKLLHTELAADRGMVHRFMNEASAAGTLGHPHIVESTDMGFTREGIPYIVFEYLEGCLLSEEIQRVGTLPVRRALLIVRQIASALEAAHNAQIAHLDLKSDNVFLTDRGTALDHTKLLDFGISRFMAFDSEDTQSGILMGTPEFMAPEQVTSPDVADCRADIYALGVLLYEMLAGHCPFVSDDPRCVLERIVYETPPPIERPVPPALERLLFGGLLVKAREQRLQTMGEIITILDSLIVAMRSGVPDPLDTFEESSAELEGTLVQPLWAVESWFDNAPHQLEGAREATPWEVEVWP